MYTAIVLDFTGQVGEPF